jgi:hypothetical protein
MTAFLSAIKNSLHMIENTTKIDDFTMSISIGSMWVTESLKIKRK